MLFKIIGDVHSNFKNYQILIESAPFSICVGDVGFNYDYLIDNIDPLAHRFIAGNHDNYDIIDTVPHFLGDYGEVKTPIGNVFFVRGAFSIDGKVRAIKDKVLNEKTFWPECEELSYSQALQAFEYYKQLKPKMIISHECPFGILPYLTMKHMTKNFGYKHENLRTLTNNLLQCMLEYNAPKIHCFGHYHQKWYKMINNTLFICVKDQRCVTFMEDGRIRYGKNLLKYNWKTLLGEDI